MKRGDTVLSGISCRKCYQPYFTNFGQVNWCDGDHKYYENMMNVYKARMCIFCLTDTEHGDLETALGEFIMMLKEGVPYRKYRKIKRRGKWKRL